MGQPKKTKTQAELDAEEQKLSSGGDLIDIEIDKKAAKKPEVKVVKDENSVELHDFVKSTEKASRPDAKEKLNLVKLAKGEINYNCPKGEEHLVHAIMDKEKFDSDGEKISVAFLQKFDVNTFAQIVKTAKQIGYAGKRKGKEWYGIKIVHKPTV